MKHFDEAIIQAFLDGELTEAILPQVTQHLSVCEDCANRLLEAEAETVEIGSAFAADETAAFVPTQRIWARINNEIDFLAAPPPTAADKSQTKFFWQTLRDFFTPAQIGFAAGLAAVVLTSLFALKVLQINSNTNANTAEEKALVPPILEQPQAIAQASPTNEKQFDEKQFAPALSEIEPTTAVYRAQTILKQTRRNPKSEIRISNAVLPEEREYLKSIARLSQAVKANDENTMRPSFRVDYESSLAVMNKAISVMQKQLRRNPGDENARRILFASYQNKIDLLNAVADKSQLVAAAR
jgi:hypothetical protein